MSYELAPSGSQSSTSLRIENTSQNDMTLELFANKLSVDENGKETLSPAEDDFLIFPPQMILKSGKTQAVRVKYIGDPNIEESNPYRISIKQIPVDLSGEGKTSVGLVVNFHTLADVAPKKSKAKLSVESISRNAAGKWDMAIMNNGNKMGRLTKTSWVMTDNGKTKKITRDEISKFSQKNLVLPGSVLNITIPAVEGFNPNTTSVKIDAG